MDSVLPSGADDDVARGSSAEFAATAHADAPTGNHRPLSGHAPIRGVTGPQRAAPASGKLQASKQAASPSTAVPIAPLPRRTGTPAVGMIGADAEVSNAKRPSFAARSDHEAPASRVPAAPAPATPAPASPAPTYNPAPTSSPGPAAPSTPAHTPAAAAPAAGLCVNCGFDVPAGYGFCGVCGTPRAAAASPGARTNVGYLALIDELGNEAERFDLKPGKNVIGCGPQCDVQFSDDLLASEHCNLVTDDEVFRLQPIDAFNGTYVRISAPVELQHGDVVRVGQEVLRFERIEEVPAEISQRTSQAFRVGCPPPRGVWGRLCQVGLRRQVANAYLLSHRDVFLGRERGDILFPKDGFVSGSHAVISERGGRIYLKDLGSSNGTFLRVKQEKSLRNGDLLLLGRNLLCVHIEG